MNHISHSSILPALSTEAICQFQHGVHLLLSSQWAALKIAVEDELGGPQTLNKFQQLLSDTYNWFTQSKEPLYIEDLETMLDDSMVSFFNMEVEDGSIEEMAEKLMIMHEECMASDYSSINKLNDSNGKNRGEVRVIKQVDESEDEEESGMELYGVKMEDAEAAGNGFKNDKNDSVVSKMDDDDDDGWEVVRHRSRQKGRRGY